MDVRPEIGLAAARTQLRHLARRWHMRLLLSAALRSTSLALLCFAFCGLFTEPQAAWRAVAAGAIGLLAFAGQTLLLKKKSGDERALLRHLNRVKPEWEESGELLLASEEALTTLARMQRRRLLQYFPPVLKNSLLPRQPVRDAVRFFALITAASLLVMALPPFIPNQEKFPPLPEPLSLPATSVPAPPAQIEKASITIVPPRYTGKPVRKVTQFDLEAEEGAQITWEITFNQPLRGATLILVNADTLALREIRTGTYAVSAYLQENILYQFSATRPDGKTQMLEYHRVQVLNDLPPAIVVIHPEPRTEVNTVHAPSIRLEAIIDDDYGVHHAELVATLARGSGEGIKFRESKLALGNTQKDSRQHWRVNMQLDLYALGMNPGDELYFYFTALDQREPTAQAGRSDTYFIIWNDTARVEVAASTGLLVNPLPEYFRSQRQIIIDTEQLLQDRPQLAESEFKRRAQNLGLEQRALRMRYSQFLGEELQNETNLPSPAGEGGVEYEHGDEHENAGAASTAGGDNTGAEEIIDQFVHRHDTEDNATLFAPSIKAQLQAALAEMWEAELRLRTHKPKEALPHEYRALARLKAVQQSTRAYVQRVGFEPPPIEEEEKRLSGNLEKAAGGRWQKEVHEKKTLSAARQALTILQNLQDAHPKISARDIEILERAGQEIARRALAQPGRHLQALQDLRTLIANLNDHGELSSALALSVQRALWQLLPPAEPQPALRHEAPTTLSEKYFRQLSNLHSE